MKRDSHLHGNNLLRPLYRYSQTIDKYSYQYCWSEKTARVISKLKRVIRGHRERYSQLNLANVDPAALTKWALVSYISEPVYIHRRNPRFYRNNNIWFVQTLVRILNELGYWVDLIDYRDTHFTPSIPYHLFIGHGGINFTQIAGRLPESVRKIYFSTGSYWKFSNDREKMRFEGLYQRKGVRLPYDRFVSEGEEAALGAAQAILGIGNEATRFSYTQFSGYNTRPIIMIDGAALWDAQDDWCKKDYELGRQHFLYYAGDGNVHKGLDLLLEAFSDLDQHLWISSKIDQEFGRVYRHELEDYPNIHLIGWTLPRSASFYRLMKTCNFTILPSCSEGQSQSTVECMNQGVIPIVSRFSGLDIDSYGMILDNCTIEEIREVVCSLSAYSPEHCQEMSVAARQAAITRYSEKTFRKNLQSAFETLTGSV